jgi:hypothetical protein
LGSRRAAFTNRFNPSNALGMDMVPAADLTRKSANRPIWPVHAFAPSRRAWFETR